ncbi:MAG: HAD-IA family hydrolase [Bacillota bacterium]
MSKKPAILSVDEVKTYKPAPRVYELVTEKFGVSSQEVLFHSSNAWDVAGAASFGFNVAWINRFNNTKETLPFGPHLELKSLDRLPEFLR